jgi:hypothetical protein
LDRVVIMQETYISDLNFILYIYVMCVLSVVYDNEIWRVREKKVVACFPYQPVVKTPRTPSKAGNVISSEIHPKKLHPRGEIPCSVQIAIMNTLCSYILQINLYVLPIYVMLSWEIGVYSGSDGNNKYGKRRITDNHIRSILYYKGWFCLCRQRNMRGSLSRYVSRSAF